MNPAYEVVIRRPAEKDVRRLSPKIQRQVTERLRELIDDPRPHDMKHLRRPERAYRIDSGEYRILYEIDDERKRVTIRAVKHRREAYRNL